ncbi:macrophage-expressed gene 1 protein-like [Argopecten irradians]|uniref:macrophage-expressed gene 1 protein-like n=1 Tax=Argopecten irradians TaxID=31199 RepID=UPI0037220556
MHFCNNHYNKLSYTNMAYRCKSAILVLLAFTVIPDARTSPDVDKGDQITFSVGDPQRCLQKSLNKYLRRYEVLPGGGWDNLRNKHGGQVINYNYSLCQTTDDGRYLLPDDIYSVPLKQSKLETFAEMFSHWQNYTSTTSSTVNAEAGYHTESFGIEGSFSHESESVRSRQMIDKSVTTRVQMRYVRYSAKLQPGTALNPHFKARLLSIASLIVKKQKRMASYESQILVRDFGTHVITSVDAGAALVQQDQIKTTYARSYSSDKRIVLTSASASFYSKFNVKGGYEHSTSQEMIDQYLGNRTHSETATIGGSVYKPENFSLNDWADSIADNLVAIDRAGDPLDFLLTPMVLLELPMSVLSELREIVKNSISLYYKHNVYRGCTDADSPNFSFQANVNDGTCRSLSNNYTFGGVYQTCSMSGNVKSNTCSELDQKNPLTGDYTCPPGYEEVEIDVGSKNTPNTVRRCHNCGFFGWSTCCKDYVSSQTASYKGYWCVATGKVDSGFGYLFGGVFTDTNGNPLTGDRSCPPYFHEMKLSSNLRVCITDDYELGFRYSVPFAGFFSCKTGNPLKLDSDEENKHKRSTTKMFSLEAFLINSGPSHWPRGCPTGYSEHLAVVSNGCEISYCIQSNALTGRGLPDIKRPPFIQIPNEEYTDNSTFMTSNDGLVWKDITLSNDISNNNFQESAIEMESANEKDESRRTLGDDGLTQGAVVVIAVAVTIASMLLILFVVKIVQNNRNKNRPGEYRRLESDSLIQHQRVGYESPEDNDQVEVQVES